MGNGRSFLCWGTALFFRNMGGTSGVHCQDILYRLGYKFPPEKEGEMPWKEVGVKDQRISLVARALGGRETMTDLCQKYGISRPTGYLWVKRFREGGSFQALEEKSR